MAVSTMYCLLPSMRRYQMESRGASWQDKFFPQIKHWVAMAAWDSREIKPVLKRMLGNESGFHEAIEQARYQHFSELIDGKATDRFVGLVHRVLKKRA